MKVLLCHNFYQQPGGEDQSFAEEAALLESRGHHVIRFTQHNDAIRKMNPLTVAARTLWSSKSYHELRRLIQKEKPDVMHCTNTFPLISPAAYYAARKEKVAVVQSLRNYRMFCSGAYFMRDGKVCEDCMGRRFAWPAIAHKCYRGSRAGSTVLASMIAIHRSVGTWAKMVDRYFALTNFSRAKFIQGGLPAERIDLKPNFLLEDPGPGTGVGGYAVFVGRLSREKGVDLLCKIWPELQSAPRLKIIGDGPLLEELKIACQRNPSRMEWCGRMNREDVLQAVGNATCLIQPSLWYEGFPRTILEAFSKGTPVIASRLGSMEEIVEHEKSGLLAAPNEVDFKQAIDRFFLSGTAQAEMRLAARQQFLDRYSAQTNYQLLLQIYERAIETARQRKR